LRAAESRKINTFFLGKFEIMAYVAYEIKMTKDTPTGTRHLVKCNRLGKYAICSWVGSTGSAMGTVECQGDYKYVMKNWKKIVGKYVPVT
jgi:hypothetical protein